MKRAALFVGINDYNKPLASLKCARKDADTLYGLFLREYTHGMVDFLHDVSSGEIIKTIQKRMETLSEGDLFFFYFSGHGVEERNNHLLLTTGTQLLGDEWHDAFSINMLKSLVTKKPGVQTVIVIDSCRESVYHGARSAGVAEQSRGMTMKRVAEEKSADAAMLPPVILCSCAGGERAFEIEETGHGIFTLALKECLESGKFFTLDEIANNVTERLKTFISKHKFSGNQTPELHKSPGINPVLWGNPNAAKMVESENSKAVSEEERKLDKEYNKLYAKAEVLVENGRFDWKEEFKQRLESCERIYETGLTQDAIDALNDLFSWHETQKRSKTNEIKTENVQDAAVETVSLPEKEVKQPETEKKTSWIKRIIGFFVDYVLTLFLILALSGSLAVKEPIGSSITVAILYAALLLFRKNWYFLLCNLFMATFCLSLFHSGWWWFACILAALVMFCLCMIDTIPAKTKKCRGLYVYLSFMLALCISASGKSYHMMGVLLCSSLFFPLIYSFPRVVSWLSICLCCILAFYWSAWWLIGVPIFLIVLLAIWGSQDDKVKESDSNVAAQK